MPKELIHFKIALKTAERLTESRLGKSLDAHPHGLLLGAVLHDALFYSISSKAHPLIHLAHRFHGADGHDTYTLLRLQAEHAAQAKEPDLPTAILVGMASHLAADATLHPLVWHLSGHYFSPDQRTRSNARQRHRALESLMDMVACPEMIGRPLFSIRRLVHRLGDDMYHAPSHQAARGTGRLDTGAIPHGACPRLCGIRNTPGTLSRHPRWLAPCGRHCHTCPCVLRR